MSNEYQKLEVERDAAWDEFEANPTGKNWQFFAEADRLMKAANPSNNATEQGVAVDSPSCGDYTPAFLIPGSPCLNCDADPASH